MTKSIGWALLITALLGAACTKEPEPSETDKAKSAVEEPKPEPEPAEPKDEVLERAQQIFGTLPKTMKPTGYEVTEAKIALGRMLYFETRLSKNHDISCNTCHVLDQYGIDPRPEPMEKGTSLGHKNQLGERNSPTVYNSALQFVQFWDGRGADVEDQAKQPILNPVEMAMPDEKAVVAVIRSIPGYEPMFEKAFGEDAEITYDQIAEAIGAFERQLVTPDPFDEYLAGKADAIDEQAKKGLETFMNKGCTTCHIGPGIGGTMYQKLGLLKPYETDDTGRHQETEQESDKFFFKVPTLRNVEKTAPYLHDGSVKTLEEAVQLMAKHQTPTGELSDAEVADVVAFLKTLTGDLPPKEMIAEPELPESGPKTPKPDPS